MNLAVVVILALRPVLGGVMVSWNHVERTLYIVTAEVEVRIRLHIVMAEVRF